MSDDFVIQTTFAAAPDRLYQALATEQGIAGWWTKSAGKHAR